MEFVNVIVLGLVTVQSAAIGYLVLANNKLNKNVEDMSSLLNKSVMAAEEFRSNLNTMLDDKNKEIQKALSETNQEVRAQITSQKSLIEESSEKTRNNLGQVLDTLEYLATEVNIK